jgi:predicted nucleotidyltransferase
VHPDIAAKRDSLIALCERYDVARLEVFGSAARGVDFDPEKSDVDFLVEFKTESQLNPLHQFFDFADALKDLFGRPVDLVESSAIGNPFIRASIDRSREVVYGEASRT